MSTRLASLADSAGNGPATFTQQWAARCFYLYDHPANAVARSGNLSSVTDQGAGLFQLSFVNNFATATYSGVDRAGGYQSATSTVANRTNSQAYGVNDATPLGGKSTSTYRIATYNVGGGFFDQSGNSGNMIGDLA